MAESQSSGPLVGQDVYYQFSSTVVQSARITGVNSDGTVSLTTFPAGSSPSTQASIHFDYTGASGTWRYPPLGVN